MIRMCDIYTPHTPPLITRPLIHICIYHRLVGLAAQLPRTMILDRGPLRVRRDNDEMGGDEATRGDMSEVHTLLIAITPRFSTDYHILCLLKNNNHILYLLTTHPLINRPMTFPH